MSLRVLVAGMVLQLWLTHYFVGDLIPILFIAIFMKSRYSLGLALAS